MVQVQYCYYCNSKVQRYFCTFWAVAISQTQILLVS